MFCTVDVHEIDGSNFFRYNNILFDTFPAHFLAREHDQDLNLNGRASSLLFFDAGVSHPEWMFESPSQLGRLNILRAFQFYEGDSFTFFTRPDDLGVGNRFHVIVRDSYIRHHVSLRIDRYGRKDFNALPLRAQLTLRKDFKKEVEQESHLLLSGPFRFPLELPAMALR